MDVADATDSLATRVNAVLVLEHVLGVTLLWRDAEVWATRCLADILDIVDDCNVFVPRWRGHVHNPGA